jgi:hypothetical protein
MPYTAPARPQHRLPRDGVGEVLAGDEEREERGARRAVERAGGADDGEDGEDGVEAGSRRVRQAPEGEGREREDEVAGDEDAAPVEAVGELPRDDGEAHDRDELREPEVREVDLAARELVDLEAHGRALHLDRERREETGGGVVAEVAVGEGGEGGGRSVGRWGSFHRWGEDRRGRAAGEQPGRRGLRPFASSAGCA